MAADTYNDQQQDWWALQGDPPQADAPAVADAPAAAASTAAGNPYGQLAAGFGAPPAPYVSNPNAPQFTALATPAALQSAYVAPTWQGGDYKDPTKPLALQTAFAAPTQAELEASPGYLSRLSAGNRVNQMAAAAKGTVLNGGTVRAGNRYAQDFASNEYSNLFGQRVTERGIADSEYGADVGNARSAFSTNFGVFQTGAQNSLAARQQNAGEFQTAEANNQQDYQNRYSSYLNDNARTLNDYLQNYNIQHTSDTDTWNRLKDVSTLGETAANQTRVS